MTFELRVRTPGPDLTGREIFITGGTGFVGRTLLDYFTELATTASQRFGVTVMSRSPERFRTLWPQYSTQRWLRVVQGDLHHFPSALTGGVTDVIHAAASTHGVARASEWRDEIVVGTGAALEWARKFKVNRFLYVSSGAVYGTAPPSEGVLREERTDVPIVSDTLTVYGEAKRAAEKLCEEAINRHALEVVIARCFAFVSRHVPPSGPYAIGNFIHDALLNEVVRVKGGGRQLRSYLYGRDLSQWLLTLLLRGRRGECYNVGSDVAISLFDLANLVVALLSPGKRVLLEDANVGNGANSKYVPDIAKAKALGLSVVTSLDDAIKLSAAGFELKC